MVEVRMLDKKLIANLASVEENRNFIKGVYVSLDTDEKKEQMIAYITENRKSGKALSMSDVYIKELQINGVL